MEFRRSKDLSDKDLGTPPVMHDGTVRGVDEGDGWVRVADAEPARFMPKEINGQRVLFLLEAQSMAQGQTPAAVVEHAPQAPAAAREPAVGGEPSPQEAGSEIAEFDASEQVADSTIALSPPPAPRFRIDSPCVPWGVSRADQSSENTLREHALHRPATCICT